MKKWDENEDWGVPRWVFPTRRIKRIEPADEAPLVVPKVIRQYARKRKVSPAEPENEPVTPPVATACSEQNVQIKIKEEYIPDIKIMNLGVEVHSQTEEQNASQSMSSALTFYRNYKVIQSENLGEIEIITGNDAQQICSSQVKNTVEIKQENLAEKKTSNSNVSEREQEPRMGFFTIKIEPPDNSECTDLDPKNIAGFNLEEGEPLRVKPEKNIIKYETYSTSGEMDEDKTSLTEEIHIKLEIKCDRDDSATTVTSNIKEESVEGVTVVDQSSITAVANGSQSLVTRGYRDVIQTNMKKPDPTALEKCYVDVAPTNSQQVVDPENLAGLKVVANSQIFTCDTCSNNFQSKMALRKHIRREHSVAKPYQCHCGMRFSYNYMLLAHERRHSGSLHCDICPKRFASAQKLALHLNTHLRERLFSCPICGRRYPVLYHLKRHAARHNTSNTFQCGLCSESYRCIFDLRRHSERNHGEKIVFPCYVCDKSLSSNAEHLAHVKSHDNALHYCVFCSKRFIDVRKWEQHSAVHMERLDAVAPVFMPYACRVCGKRFEFRSCLRSHMASHTLERPYQCKKCVKTFKTRSAAKEHERGHDKPYSCTECFARFAKGNALTRHMVLHSGERPHACAVCGRAFAQRSAMLQHVQRFHTPGLKRVRVAKRETKKLKPDDAGLDNGNGDPKL